MEKDVLAMIVMAVIINWPQKVIPTFITGGV